MVVLGYFCPLGYFWIWGDWDILRLKVLGNFPPWDIVWSEGIRKF